MPSWKDYFTHNKRERNGTLLLVLILVGMITFLQLSKGLVANDVSDFREYEDEVNGFYEQQEESAGHNTYSITPELQDEAKASGSRLFSFDPNNLPIEKWVMLGLSEKQAASIHRYESKGGKFRKKADVKKMYVINDEMYARLEPHIHIKKVEQSNPRKYEDYAASAPAKKYPTQKPWEIKSPIELNTADSASLVRLRGIGPSFAKRIIKYRNMLGGFTSKSQLMEVYGMDQERYDGFIENIAVDISAVSRIDVNKFTAAEFKNHPYISWSVANALENYRKQHGPFDTLEGIKKCDLVTDELYGKIVAYLRL